MFAGVDVDDSVREELVKPVQVDSDVDVNVSEGGSSDGALPDGLAVGVAGSAIISPAAGAQG